MVQKENFPKQRKYKYFTSQKVSSQKKQESFFTENTHITERISQENTSLHNKHFYTKSLDITNMFLHKNTSQIIKDDCKMTIMKNA
jgi:hypothetical protein